MSNVLSEEKKQQVIALGKLGWPWRRIEQGTGVRRETASVYLTHPEVVGLGLGWACKDPQDRFRAQALSLQAKHRL